MPKRATLLFVLSCMSIAAPEVGEVRGAPWVYVCDRLNATIVRYDVASGESKAVITLTPGLVPDDGDFPRGIAIDADGYMYVGLHGGTKNVKRFSPRGAFLSDVTPPIGTFGTGHICISESGRLLVAGDSTQSVLRFDRVTGDLIDTLVPQSACCLTALTISGNNAYCGQAYARRVTRFDLAQTYPQGVTVLNNAPGLETLEGIAVGHNGDIFCCGNAQDLSLVQEYNASGQLVGTFADLTGLDPDGVASRGIAYDAVGERYYVTVAGAYVFQLDTAGNVVDVFTHPGLADCHAVIVSYVPPPLCTGDVDGDADTDIFDFGVLATYFGQHVSDYSDGDLDGDGDVDVFDFGLFAADFGCVE